MNIHGPFNKPHFSTGELARSQQNPPGKEVSRQKDSGDTSVDRSAAPEHTAAPEILRLQSQLRQLPEVRDARIQDVIERLSGGEFLTRESAEQTAEAILDQVLGDNH